MSGRTRRVVKGKRALLLCGGGITGALYHVGALRAFEEAFGEGACDFDVYVGTSAGATVAAFLAQGITPRRMYDAIYHEDDPFFPIHREDVYRLEPGEWLSSLLGFERFLLGLAAGKVKSAGRAPGPDVFEVAAPLPAGIFSNMPLRRFLGRTLDRAGLTDDFRDLARELYITAYDADLAERVVFGGHGWRDVPISLAIAASSAIPILFKPVQIRARDFVDGGVGKVAHLDVAEGAGAEKLLIINPIRPIRNDQEKVCMAGEDGRCMRLREKGLLHVWNQTFRMMTHNRLERSLRTHKIEEPGRRYLLMEPSVEDVIMFMYNPMSFSSRQRVLEDSYRTTRQVIARRRREFAPFMAQR